MTERTLFYSDGGFEVSAAMLKTPRKTYALGQVEYVSVSRPLLIFAGGPALGVIGFALAFRRYLLPAEIGTLVGCAVAAIVFSLLFGTLRVHSLALRDDEVAMNFGTIRRLRAVRLAVEKAMAFRDHRQRDA